MDDDLFLFEDYDPSVLSLLKQYLSESNENKVKNGDYASICLPYKAFILNSIRDRTMNLSVSDSILDSLILIEKIDRQQGIPPSDAMRDAFRAVSVHCTLKCLPLSWSSYFDAVQRIWAFRIKNLEDSGASDLLSPDLARWRRDIEAAVWDTETSQRLLRIGTLGDALNCIGVYLIEAFRSMTPALHRSPVVPSVEPTADHVASASVHSEEKVNPRENSHSSPGRHEGAGIVADSEEDQSSSGEVNKLLPTMLKTRTAGLEAGPTDSLHETFASNMEIESLHEEDSDKDRVDPTTLVSPATHHCNDKGKLNLREKSHSSGEVNELLPTVLKTRTARLQAGPTDSPYETSEVAETFASNMAIEILNKEDSDKDRGDPTTSDSPATHHCNYKAKRTIRKNSQRYKLHPSRRRPKGPLIISDLEEVERVASNMGSENLHAKATTEYSNKDSGDPTNYCTDKGERDLMVNFQTICDPNSSPRHYVGPAVYADTEEDRPSCMKFVLVSTPEIEKVRDSLKSSVADLLAAVTDPLPQALDVAERIASNMAAATKLPTDKAIREDHDRMDRSVQAKRGAPDETIGKDHKRMDGSVPALSVDHTVEPSQAREGNEAFIRPKKVRRTSLMERNNTAHTFEWEDTMDGSAEGASGSSNRCSLPSPKTKHASPLKKSEPLKWVRRRKVNKWTDVEEKALIDGVQKYGTQWKLISSIYEEILSNRTQVDLKDKWRILSRK